MPWDEIAGQERTVRVLRRALERGQPHHAYLLAGPEGVGKELLARLFAQAANCESTDAEHPCGRCFACTSIVRGSYPDVFWVMPQSELVARGKVSKADLEAAPSREIRVDEVRQAARRLSFAPVRGRRKIAIVAPADTLNERAQNALLKTLEEPPPQTTFLLVTAQPDSLLPTVRSRCARVQLGPLPAALVVEKLEKSGVTAAEARERAERAEGSLGRALRMTSAELQKRRDLLALLQGAVEAQDERAALDLAEEQGERDTAEELVRCAQEWIRDQLVAAAETPGPIPPVLLLRWHQHALAVVEAFERNGNPRLQLERLLLGLRSSRAAARLGGALG